MADGQPALARLALERRVTAALAKAKDPAAGAKAAITAILAGEDDELGADWQLVDGRGRRITTLEIGGLDGTHDEPAACATGRVGKVS